MSNFHWRKNTGMSEFFDGEPIGRRTPEAKQPQPISSPVKVEHWTREEMERELDKYKGAGTLRNESKLTRDKLQDRINQGKRLKEIAREFGVSVGTVSNKKREFGLMKKQQQDQGETVKTQDNHALTVHSVDQKRTLDDPVPPLVTKRVRLDNPNARIAQRVTEKWINDEAAKVPDDHKEAEIDRTDGYTVTANGNKREADNLRERLHDLQQERDNLKTINRSHEDQIDEQRQEIEEKTDELQDKNRTIDTLRSMNARKNEETSRLRKECDRLAGEVNGLQHQGGDGELREENSKLKEENKQLKTKADQLDEELRNALMSDRADDPDPRADLRGRGGVQLNHNTLTIEPPVDDVEQDERYLSVARALKAHLPG